MKDEYIIIEGAKENNLKNINVKIPKNKLVVFTGLSGSGKSSLAFETIYAEGQRRYMESLSSYARMFIGQMEKPDVERIEGLSPAISIDQKTTSKNPRSTVGTVTEIYDYLRLLYARVGTPHCPVCGKEINAQTVDQMTDAIMNLPIGTKVQLMAPVVRGRKGEYTKLLEVLRKNGYSRVRVDGQMYELDEEIVLEKYKIHNIEVIVDRLIIKEGIESRIAESLETVLTLASGLALVHVMPKSEDEDNQAPESYEMLFSKNFSCSTCGISLPEVSPKMFSFNSPLGACDKCGGIGRVMQFDEKYFESKIEHRSFSDLGQAMLLNNSMPERRAIVDAISKEYGFDPIMEFKTYSDEVKNMIINGSGTRVIKYSGGFTDHEEPFPGLMKVLESRYERKMQGKFEVYPIEYYMHEDTCRQCEGKRLNANALAFTVGDKNIYEFTSMPVNEAYDFISNIELSPEKSAIAASIIKELKGRLDFLKNVGLGYLTLSRSSGTLSGGESQRIRLATQIGAGLAGVIYILDEPSIGLHQRDNAKLLKTLTDLKDLGNSLIVVEHDEETIRAADFVVDIGPKAGVHGGEVIFAGTPEEMMKCKESITGKYLSGEMSIKVPGERRVGSGKYIEVMGARANNLKNVNVRFPLGTFICVTGVSGSGKSSLVNEVLSKAIINGSYGKGDVYDDIAGLDNIDKLIMIDQSPIGRTPRSNPATYVGLFTPIRELFALVPEARARGYKASRFSFNVKGGRCDACDGDGIKKIEMNFLPDVFVPCEVCKGKRYNRETLEIRYKGKNIADVLDMTVDDALVFFEDIPQIKRKVEMLSKVGLGYIKLGQSSTSLSGGEAQRVKLADELSKMSTSRTLYILDEPTTGLHTHDVKQLIEILQQLINGGNTVIVIEHNLDIIKNSDYIIDMGYEGGNEGGNVVACGTPEQIAMDTRSYTGQYLKGLLNNG
ncbi:MAG: excinuclease ABC subunit UvrA [Clostridia bacterium]|nr:excinuclease ABC subunit UvrA [Clostridia bacterium]